MAKLYFNNQDVINLKGVVVRGLKTKNKFQTSEPECKVFGIRPKGLLEGFTKFDGTLDVKLPLDFNQDIKVDDIVEFSEVSVVPYSFKDKGYVSYSIKAVNCEVVDHLKF